MTSFKTGWMAVGSGKEKDQPKETLETAEFERQIAHEMLESSQVLLWQSVGLPYTKRSFVYSFHDRVKDVRRLRMRKPNRKLNRNW